MGNSCIDQGQESTRDRILSAAMKRFSEHSYEITTLRDIAADVGIDVALVHRTFGSKEKLFIAAIDATAQMDRALDSPAADLAATMIGGLYDPERSKNSTLGTPLGITLHSLSSPTAGPVLRKFLEESVIAPLAGKLGHADPTRVTVMVAFLAGLNIFRNLMELEALSDSKRDKVEPLIAKAVSAVLETS